MVAEDAFASRLSDRQLIIAQLAARNGEATEAEVGCSSVVRKLSRAALPPPTHCTTLSERAAVDDDNTTAQIATRQRPFTATITGCTTCDCSKIDPRDVTGILGAFHL